MKFFCFSFRIVLLQTGMGFGNTGFLLFNGEYIPPDHPWHQTVMDWIIKQAFLGKSIDELVIGTGTSTGTEPPVIKPLDPTKPPISITAPPTTTPKSPIWTTTSRSLIWTTAPPTTTSKPLIWITTPKTVTFKPRIVTSPVDLLFPTTRPPIVTTKATIKTTMIKEVPRVKFENLLAMLGLYRNLGLTEATTTSTPPVTENPIDIGPPNMSRLIIRLLRRNRLKAMSAILLLPK